MGFAFFAFETGRELCQKVVLVNFPETAVVLWRTEAEAQAQTEWRGGKQVVVCKNTQGWRLVQGES